MSFGVVGNFSMSFFSALSDWSLGRSRTSFWVGADIGFSSLISGS